MDLKDFRKKHGLRNLSFASADDLMDILKLSPGSVSHFGLLSDEKCRVHFFLDSQFEDNMMGIHPNDNTATVWIKTADLVKLLNEHGTTVEFAEV